MDIRCEKCNTEYEFDDERVTEEGVTVKCSTCGHLFKIRKKSFVLTEPVMLGKKEGEEDADRNWMVRRSDGTVLSFKELTTLQKWIVEQKVSREDEISKSGETWKRLGSIAELASFFQVVDKAAGQPQQSAGGLEIQPPAPAPGSRDTQPLPAAQPIEAAPTPVGVPASPPPVESQPAAAEPQAPEAAQQGFGPAGEQPQVPATTSPGMPQSAPPAAEEDAAPPPATAPQADAQHPVPEPAAQAADFGSEPDSWGDEPYDESDDVVEKWKKRGRRKWFFIVPLIVIVLGLGGWYLLSEETFMQAFYSLTGKKKTVSEAARQKYQTGVAHFLNDSAAELEAATVDLTGAIEQAQGKYPQAMAALAEVYITQAEKANERAEKVSAKIDEMAAEVNELKPADGSEPEGDLAKKIAEIHNAKVELQRERMKIVDAARKKLEEAKRLIDGAAGLDADALEPKRALANYLRVMSGDRALVEAPLKEAAAIDAKDPGLLYVDGASLAADEASLQVAAEKLALAISKQPALLRARYKLAQVLIALERNDEARAELTQIMTQSPGHAQAKELMAAIEPEEKPAAGEEEEKPAAEKKPDQPETYEGWMKQANALQRKGLTRKALKAYDAALGLQPEDAEALYGKGLCFLDDGAFGAAAGWFRRALKANPRFADAIMGLAEAYKYKGDNEQAVKYYGRYLEVRPDGPEAAVARRNLQELK